MSPGDFSNYQNLIDLFKNLRDNINHKKVLKNKINFKSDLDKIKKGNPNLKSKEQISAIQNVEKLFYLREKINDFLETILFCYMKLNRKQHLEGVSKY